jgi:Lrp/AsnC family transcriptional regulator, leucine-responsive regulatory protein
MKNKVVAFVFVQTDSTERNVAGLLKRIPHVDEVHRVAGEDCYLLKVCLPDTAALGRLVKEKIERIEFVHNTRTTIVLKTFKDRNNTASARRSGRSEQYIGER